MGSNMAEAHPVGFQWVVEAKARGAKVIHIDPHFTRTSALADTFVPIRVGSDIAFLGGVIRHILENGLDFREYVTAYTNAAALISPEYRDTEDLDGLFSGFDPEKGAYDTVSWQYRATGPPPGDEERPQEAQSDATGAGGAPIAAHAEATDPTLQHPDCVYQILKRHFARYTPEFVEEVCGVPQERSARSATPGRPTPAASAPPR